MCIFTTVNINTAENIYILIINGTWRPRIYGALEYVKRS